MADLKFEHFLYYQPSYPEEQPTDRYYYRLCCRLIELAEKSGLVSDYEDITVKRAMVSLTGYYQDVICDGGLWRAFISQCRSLYGRTLPFYETDDDYMDYELNPQDVQFMVWYALSMYSGKHHFANPLDDKLMALAKILYDELERAYDESPMPEGYVFGRELELNDPNDAQTLYDLAVWLFNRSWLLTPAYAMDMAGIVAGFDIEKNREEFQKRLEQAMSEDPTGPLALYTSEWVSLVAEGKLPRVYHPKKKDTGDHPYYTAFTRATGGSPIAYFHDYKSLNEFFIKTLGWAENEEHLPQMKNSSDFVLLVNREKGMLLARNVARCIADAENPWYDKEYARAHAFDFFSVRGLCPHDLMTYCLEHHFLPDATFPGSDDTRLVADNADFIARLYLQKYYRGD